MNRGGKEKKRVTGEVYMNCVCVCGVSERAFPK